MRSHPEIIADAKQSDPTLAERLGVSAHQVRDWRLRKRIPAEHWLAFERAGLSSLRELAEAAANRTAA